MTIPVGDLLTSFDGQEIIYDIEIAMIEPLSISLFISDKESF